MIDPLLSVRSLTTVIRRGAITFPVVRDVSFDISAGETVGMVGESGSGKSMTVLSVMGLLPASAEIVRGEVHFEGVDLVRADPEQRRQITGARVAMIYQDPMTSLNPVMRIGAQIEEVGTVHGMTKREAKDRSLQVLGEVGIPQPARAAMSFPHEFSGGMRQRVVIAMALALSPRLVIADEPTTALDVTIQQQIIGLVRRLQEATGMAVVWITHDLRVIARVAHRLLVMYGGYLVEDGPARDIFAQAEHPYTAALIRSIPPLRGDMRMPLKQISGSPPDLSQPPAGCPFHPRCPQAVAICTQQMPPTTTRGNVEAACWVQPADWRTP